MVYFLHFICGLLVRINLAKFLLALYSLDLLNIGKTTNKKDDYVTQKEKQTLVFSLKIVALLTTLPHSFIQTKGRKKKLKLTDMLP